MLVLQQHLDQARVALRIGIARRALGQRLGLHLARELVALRADLRPVGHRVLHILGRAQHGLAVDGERLGMAPPGLRHLGIDAAEVEQAPAQPGQRAGLERGRLEQRPVERLEAEDPRQRQLRVVLGQRGADAGVARRQPPLGRHHVGAAAQQRVRADCGRQARHHRVRDRRAQLRRVGAGCRAHQDVQPVGLARSLGQQGRTLRARLREPRLGLGLFAPCRHAVADAIADQRDQLAVGLDLLLDDGDARLQAAQPEIVIGRVGRHRDARTGMQGLGRLGLGLAAQAAGQVELPARTEAELGIALVAIVAGQGRADPAQRRFQRLPLACGRALD